MLFRSHLRRMRFGASSEALSAEQRDLFQETLASDSAAAADELARRLAAAQAAPTAPPTIRPRAGRQPLPEHLPRIEHRHEPESCTCGHCGKELIKIGEDISEQLDVEPARFFVHRHIRSQYACRACETVSAAPIPPAVIDGGLAAGTLEAGGAAPSAAAEAAQLVVAAALPPAGRPRRPAGSGDRNRTSVSSAPRRPPGGGR